MGFGTSEELMVRNRINSSNGTVKRTGRGNPQ